MKKRDFILIGAIIAVILIAFGVMSLVKQNGDYVIVRVAGQEVARYSLSKNGVYELNGGTNILCIENGEAYLKDADCPDKLCVNQGRIDKSGETITCLPNKLTVTVYSSESGEVELVG